MSGPGIQPVFGGGGFGFGLFGDESLEQVFQILLDNGCSTIDSGRAYGNSEERIGQLKAGDRFSIDTKTPGGLVKGESTEEGIVKHAEESCQKTGVKQLNIFYIHTPDATLDFHSQLRGINTAYKQGLFRRFGLSNFSAAQVQDAHDYCKSQGFVLPTVYQGNYSAVARLQETQILPTLRKLGISFYAYSPMAGGFLSKTVKQITEGGKEAGRVGAEGPMGKLYSGLYNKPAMLEGLAKWEKAAEVAGCSKGELAYRWAIFDSALSGKFGDAVIFGASRVEQITETLGWWKKGSVGPEAKALIDGMWASVEHEATLNNVSDKGDYAVKIT